MMEEINEFSSINEYKRFVEYVERQVKKNELVEVSTNNNQQQYYDLKEYQCKQCKHKWILAIPDYPFRGFWRKVNN
jgi:predicted transposase YdaD